MQSPQAGKAKSTSNKGTTKSFSHSPQKRIEKPNPLDKLEQLDTLGNGSYGTVVRVQTKTDGRQFAMKIINKRKIE
jgi:hypothetical protein